MMKRPHKHTNKVITGLGVGAGLMLENISALQGVLPNGWYIGVFALAFIVDWLLDDHE
jgi:hypothetical protein